MDVGHSERAGSDPVKVVSMAGARLLDMHVKDLRSLTDKSSQCDVGDGKIPIPALFKALQKAGYKGCVNLEYEINAEKPMPGMQRSFSYMRGVMAGIKA
jgi:sugar phosphate isomerase/epimerase